MFSAFRRDTTTGGSNPSTTVATSGTDFEEECWENQRFGFHKGWGPYRLPVDRPLWSNKKGNARLQKGSFLLPSQQWVWKGDWMLDTQGMELPEGGLSAAAADAEESIGWLYAADFTVPTRFCSKKPSALSMVRRRRWVRTRTALEASMTSPRAGAGGEGGRSASGQNGGNSTVGVGFVATSGGGDHLLSSSSASSPTAVFQTQRHWAQVLFYGLLGANARDSDREMRRNHESYHRFQLYDPHRTKGLLPSPQRDGSQEDDLDDDGDTRTSAAPSEGAATSSSESVFGVEYNASARERSLVFRFGVATQLRDHVWHAWLKASIGRVQRACPDGEDQYGRMAVLASQTTSGNELLEITQDVVRTAPRHPFFDGTGSVGYCRLTNTLLALALSPRSPGYHQAFSYIAAVLLLNTSAERCYWIMEVLFEVLLPNGFHDQYLLQNDLVIFHEILRDSFPAVDLHFQRHQIDVAVFVTGWLQGLYCAHLPFCSAARVLDVMFAEGNSSILVRLLVAFVRLHEKALMRMDSSCSLGQFANDWARSLFDLQEWLEAVAKEDEQTQAEHHTSSVAATGAGGAQQGSNNHNTLSFRILKRRSELAVAPKPNARER